MPRNDSILKRLKAALTSQLNVKIVESFQAVDTSASSQRGGRKRLVATLAASETAPLQMTLAGEVEVHAHGVVLDEVLGTLGLLIVCNSSGKESKGDSHGQVGQVEQAIHDALHLRQVLVQQTRRPVGGPRRTAYNVEIVFVVDQPLQSGNDGIKPLEEITERLREIMAETSFLHAIGVNVLSMSPMKKADEAIPESDMRRAFPWLLRDVRKWFRHSEQVEPAAGFPALQLESLTLRDFRVAGQRKWQTNSADNDARLRGSKRAEALHLIHGQNGSGKSSLTEAIELALTDKLDRLEDVPGKQSDYVSILTNRERRAADPEVVAEIVLSVREAVVESENPEAGRQPNSRSAQSFDLTCRVAEKGEEQNGERLGDDRLWKRLCGTEHSRFRNAASFRLDQVFSDLLVRSSSARRAELFLEAFFPGRADQIERARVALAEFDAAWSVLPKQARDRFRTGRHNPSPQGAAEIVDEVFAQANAVPTIVAMAGFDVKPASIATSLTMFLDEHWPADLRRLVSGGKKSKIDNLPTSLKKLDAAFEATKNAAEQTLDDLHAALPLLETLNRWDARSGSTDGTIKKFASRLNDWLTHHADHDLAEKGRQLVHTRLLLGKQEELEASVVAQQISEMDDDAESLATRLNALTGSAQRLNRLREESHRAVLDFKVAGDASASDNAERPHLDREALASLDRLIHVDDSEPISTTVKNCVENQSLHEFVLTLPGGKKSTVQIGRPGGLSAAVQAAKSQQAELQNLAQRLGARNVSFIEMANALGRLKSTAEACAAVDTEVINRLEASLSGPLASALNEFVALLTPARWAYRDVVPETGFGKKTNQLDFVVSNETSADPAGEESASENGVPMWLLFNTAELNTFVLSLFLLCGPKQNNPLRLLILDDPFQNMDELTITTVARGIGRLLRLWNHEGSRLGFWNLLILVHGEDTMNRIREEISCSASYLPWLQPKELDRQTIASKSNDNNQRNNDIETEMSLVDFELDHLASKIEIVQL